MPCGLPPRGSCPKSPAHERCGRIFDINYLLGKADLKEHFPYFIFHQHEVLRFRNHRWQRSVIAAAPQAVSLVCRQRCPCRVPLNHTLQMLVLPLREILLRVAEEAEEAETMIQLNLQLIEMNPEIILLVQEKKIHNYTTNCLGV